jgi:hypothetical protein
MTTANDDLRKLIYILRRDWLVGCVTLAVLVAGMTAIGVPLWVIGVALAITPVVIVVGVFLASSPQTRQN